LEVHRKQPSGFCHIMTLQSLDHYIFYLYAGVTKYFEQKLIDTIIVIKAKSTNCRIGAVD